MDKNTNIKPIQTAEERLKQINEERKELRVMVKDERELKLEKAAKMRVERDEEIENIQEVLKRIQSTIYLYNKLGKVAKIEYNIFGMIEKTIKDYFDE